MINSPIRAEGFCLPVVRQVDRFVPLMDLGGPTGELPEFADIRAYLVRHYREITAPVEIQGITYICTVYEPNDVTDHSYVLVERSGRPYSWSVPARPSSTLAAVGLENVDLYTRLSSRVLSYSEGLPPSYQSYLPTEFIVPKFWQLNASDGEKERIWSWRELAKRSRVVLVGDPGAGKTTCLRKLALDALVEDRDSERARLPVYLPLRNIDTEADPMTWVRRELLAKEAIGDDVQLNKLLESGHLLVLLDGLDEILDGHRDRVTGAILQLARTYPLLGLIISTRSTGYHWRFPGFVHLELQPFSPPDVEEWLTKRLSPFGKDVTERAIATILADEALARISGNPLLLAMTARLFERGQPLGVSRTNIVARFVDLLVDEWDMLRGIRRADVLSMDREAKYEVLCRTAFSVLNIKQETWFSSEQFAAWQQQRLYDESPEITLQVLSSHTGLLRPDKSRSGSVAWYFNEKVLVPFLAAKYLVERTDNLMESVAPHLQTEDYASVWSFACGLTVDASELVSLMLHTLDLDPREKARLLADAIVQNVNMSRSIFEDSCRFIRTTLEDSSREQDRIETSISEVNHITPKLDDRQRSGTFSTLAGTLAGGFLSPRRRAEIVRVLRQSSNSHVTDVAGAIEEGRLFPQH